VSGVLVSNSSVCVPASFLKDATSAIVRRV
jgi:hypothetical protein